MASKSPSRDPRVPKKSVKKVTKRALEVDEKDFLDMLMTEVNEDEAAEVLGKTPEEALWVGPEDEPEGNGHE
ncbi:MAG: hypothetical protein NUW12_01460 [Firmicutes bacterium]|jgi:hypothetical protein|nr:hypothetical protein [Bacillota bacterium]MDH7494613.1 hypothetical protein [Bacillota bacterium]